MFFRQGFNNLSVFAVAILITGCIGTPNLASIPFSAPTPSATLSPTATPASTPASHPSATPTVTVTPTPTSVFPAVDVVVGYGGVRASSIDAGRTWQVGNDQANNDCWGYRDIAYGAGLWVAVTYTGGFGRFSTTPDGVHWRHYESTQGAETIIYGGGMFVSDSFISTDGYNFNFRTMNANVGGHAAMAYLNGHFIISGDQNGIAVSTDGTNFNTTLNNYTSPDLNNDDSNMQKFAVGNGIIVGIAPQRVASSSNDGLTWTNQDNFFGYGTAQPVGDMVYDKFYSIVFDGTQFVIYGGSGAWGQTPTTWKSTNGINWIQSVPSGASPFLAGGIAGSHFFGLGNGNWSLASQWLSSLNGSSWSAATSVTITPPISDTSGYYINAWASGVPSSNPNTVPNLPANVELSHSQVLSTCGSPLPPGR